MDDLREALKRTLDDERLSRGERKALRELTVGRTFEPHEKSLLRAHAFMLAREELDDPRAAPVFAWLEDVLGVLEPVEPRSKPAPTEVENAAWFSPGTEPLGALLKEFRRVRTRADVCVFTITDDRISDGLLGLARRGVEVRVLTDDDKVEDRGSDIRRLREAGIHVAVDRSAAHMHHKFCVFDSVRLVTGSFNWTRSASGHNNENLLLTTEPTLVQAFGREFDRLWSQLASS